MINKERRLESEGEMDYDYVNDILLFKVKDRTYDYSIEFKNILVDIDDEQFIVGIQIFDASQFLRMGKESLRKIANWQFKAKLEDNEFRIDLHYEVVVRNQTISNNLYPIIVQRDMGLPSPQMVSTF